MRGIEVQITSLKIPSLLDFSKIKCILTIGSSVQSTSYPFKSLIFTRIDGHSTIGVSITNSDLIIGGVDIPLILDQIKRPSTFYLSDSFNTPDHRNPTRIKGDTPEITLTIKSLAEEPTNIFDSSIEKQLEEAMDKLDESYKSRKELQMSIEETTLQLSEMIKTQDSIINQHLKEKDDLNFRITEAENEAKIEKAKVLSCLTRIQELENLAEAWKNSDKQAKYIEKWCSEVSVLSDNSLYQKNE